MPDDTTRPSTPAGRGDRAATTAAAGDPHGAFDAARLHAVKDQLVPVARDLGRWARDLAARHRSGDDVLEVSTKTSPGDVVTFADAEVQRRLVPTLRAAVPEAGLIGEEGLSEDEDATAVWVIDPIDGTHNFVRDYPGFCVSIGLVVGEESVLGVIYESVEDVVYWAVRGGGAWRDETRLARPTVRDMAHALASSNLVDRTARIPAVRHTLLELARRTAGTRSSGSSCRDLCLFAEGRIDLYWQTELRPWDVAAGVALVRESGGAVAFVEGGRGWARARALTMFAGAEPLVREARGIWDEGAAG